jgi:hypothetical protein
VRFSTVLRNAACAVERFLKTKPAPISRSRLVEFELANRFGYFFFFGAAFFFAAAFFLVAFFIE